MFFARFRRYLTAIVSAAAALTLAAPAAYAQITGGDIMPDLNLHGNGWKQITNLKEMADFALALVEITVLTLAVAFHPVSVSMRRSRADFELPRTLFLYAVMGMTVGFLVLHHGYIIGFVIFGIGGLLRFKTDVENPTHTTRLILVTLIGLCVGLDLPVMAAIATISAGLIVQFMSPRAKFALEVRFSEKKSVQQSMDKLSALLNERGFTTLSVAKTKFKPAAEFLVDGARGTRREVLMREVADIQATKLVPIEDWHVD